MIIINIGYWPGSIVNLFHTVYTKMAIHINENTLTTENTQIK